MVALAGVIALAGACGGGSSPGESGGTTDMPVPSPQDTTDDGSAPDLSSTNPAGDPAGILRGRKAVPHPGGGTFYAPIRPRMYEVAAPVSCGRTDSGLLRPPRPGLKAKRLGPERVRIRVLLGEAAKQCTPRFIRLAFDVNDDPVPPAPPRSGPLIPVERFTPWLEVELLDNVVDADVVSASGVTGDGESGDSARVLIAEP